jgi:hypothetical protein
MDETRPGTVTPAERAIRRNLDPVLDRGARAIVDHASPRVQLRALGTDVAAHSQRLGSYARWHRLAGVLQYRLKLDGLQARPTLCGLLGRDQPSVAPVGKQGDHARNESDGGGWQQHVEFATRRIRAYRGLHSEPVTVV